MSLIFLPKNIKSVNVYFFKLFFQILLQFVRGYSLIKHLFISHVSIYQFLFKKKILKYF